MPDNQQQAAGAEQEQAAAEQQDVQQGDQPAAGEEQQPTTGDQQDNQQQAVGEPQKVEDLPEWTQTLIRELRAENAANRVKANKATQEAQQSIAQQIATALGITNSDKDAQKAPTVEDLARQVETERATARQAQLELAVHRAAQSMHADPVALLDSRSFLTRLDGIDPTDGDAISAAVKETVKTNPRLMAAPGGPSSPDQTGQAPGTVTPAQFQAMGYAERAHLWQTNRALYDQLAAQN